MNRPAIAEEPLTPSPSELTSGEESLGSGVRGSGCESESVDSFLRELARISEPAGRPVVPLYGPGAMIAGRYELARPIGRGAHGVVWSARDTLAGGEVAVKLLVATTKEHAARVRAEVTSLRRLRLPGVASLIDEGVDGDSVYLIMPLVRGVPFPGVEARATWEAIAPPAERLLSTLMHVHAMGIVHRDLKPANVLVEPDGHPVLLDFGLALAPAFEAIGERGRVVGTPAYLAPEQKMGRADARADLYAVGVMLYQSLTGRLPYETSDAASLLRAKDCEAVPLSKLAPDVPEHVARTVDALLSVSPDARPASAQVTLLRLRGQLDADTQLQFVFDPPGPLSPEEVRALFVGEDRLSLAVEDGTRLLHELSSGDPARVRELLDAWIRAGFCRIEAGSKPLARIEREGVDRLEIAIESRAWPEGLDAAFPLALASARRHAESGRLGAATAALAEALDRLRRGRRTTNALEAALSLWTEVALSECTPLALDRVLFELCRAGVDSPALAQMEALVRAALSLGAWTDRALELASAVPPFEDAALERHRCAVRVMAARRTSEQREIAVIAELAAWAEASSDPAARAAYSGWLGRLRYRQGRFDEAAALHARAASGAPWLAAKAAALTACASALTEAFRLEEAAVVVREAVTLSRAIRYVYGAALAEWHARVVAYRLVAPLLPDPGWIDAIASLHVRELLGLACMTEGAIAYRAGNREAARAFAAQGRRAWSVLGENAGAQLLVSALEIACSPDEEVSPQEVRSLAENALSCATSGVGIQALGLLARHVDRAMLDPARVGALAAQVPEQHHPTRIDILSVKEALAMLSKHAALDPLVSK